MPSYLDADSYRCVTSLQSELRIIRTLQKLAKRCLCPKLKTYAPDLEERRLKLVAELKMRAEEENIPLGFSDQRSAVGSLARSREPALSHIS
jgi:hypothetical protein